jgi:hypothetical protein
MGTPVNLFHSDHYEEGWDAKGNKELLWQHFKGQRMECPPSVYLSFWQNDPNVDRLKPNQGACAAITLLGLEAATGWRGGWQTTADKIRAALEKAGIEFIAENGGGPGVRLRKRF